MLVFVFYSPLDNALVKYRCRHDKLIFKDLNIIYHTSMRRITLGGCHFSFSNEVKTKVLNFESFNCQSQKPKQNQDTILTTADCIVKEAESLDCAHVD